MTRTDVPLAPTDTDDDVESSLSARRVARAAATKRAPAVKPQHEQQKKRIVAPPLRLPPPRATKIRVLDDAELDDEDVKANTKAAHAHAQADSESGVPLAPYSNDDEDFSVDPVFDGVAIVEVTRAPTVKPHQKKRGISNLPPLRVPHRATKIRILDDAELDDDELRAMENAMRTRAESASARASTLPDTGDEEGAPPPAFGSVAGGTSNPAAKSQQKKKKRGGIANLPPLRASQRATKIRVLDDSELESEELRARIAEENALRAREVATSTKVKLGGRTASEAAELALTRASPGLRHSGASLLASAALGASADARGDEPKILPQKKAGLNLHMRAPLNGGGVRSVLGPAPGTMSAIERLKLAKVTDIDATNSGGGKL